MRIDQFFPAYFSPSQPAMQNNFAVAQPQRAASQGPGVVVDISPQAWAAFDKAAFDKAGGQQAVTGSADTKGLAADAQSQGCETCSSRKYVDKSSDPSVSYQAPTRISPGQAATAVISHEREHIANDQAKAQREDRKVVSQSVTLSMSTCPECGKMYVSGGSARTVTASNNSGEQMPAEDPAKTINPGETPAS